MCICVCVHLCWWTFVLLPPVSYWEQIFQEHGCTNTCTRFCFHLFWMYTQKCNCLILWRFYVYCFLKNYDSIFYSGHTILHSQHHCTCLIFSHPWKHLFSLFFWHKLSLKGEKWYLIILLIWIFLMICDVEDHFFILLAICVYIYFLEKCLNLFKCFPISKIVSLMSLSCVVLCMLFISIHCLIHILKKFFCSVSWLFTQLVKFFNAQI